MKEDTVSIAGKKLSCKHCGKVNFKRIKTKLNSWGLTVFDAEIFAKSGVAYICTSCGLKHEFYKSTT